MAKKLSDRYQRFVAEYVVDWHATNAYKRAGFTATGNAASVNACKLLQRPEVAEAIAALKAELNARCELTAERTLREVARVAYFDPRKLFRDDGSPKPVQELDDDTAAAVAGLEVLEQYEGSGDDRVFVGYLKKYKIADKNSALDKAMKHLGLFESDNKQKVDPVLALLTDLGGRSAIPVSRDVDLDDD